MTIMRRTTKKRYKICYIAGREESYTRTRIVLHALRTASYEVVSCLPADKSFRHYPKLILQFLFKKRGCDLIVVGFYGQLLMPFVWLLTHKPILYDMYVSTYEVMVLDRGKASTHSPKAWAYYLVDKLSMWMADKIIFETNHHIMRRAKMFGISPKKFERVFLAADDSVLRPRSDQKTNGRFFVHFHGEFAPFHGVRYIIQAAKMLENESVFFQIIGRGQTYEEDRRLAEDLNIKTITFIDRVPYAELADYMSRAEICLGIFGNNLRAMGELTNKAIEALAVGRSLISARNAPVQELLQDGESVLLVDTGNPEAIAQAIRLLKSDEKLRQRIAANGHRIYLEHCSLPVFSKRFCQIIEGMLN